MNEIISLIEFECIVKSYKFDGKHWIITFKDRLLSLDSRIAKFNVYIGKGESLMEKVRDGLDCLNLKDIKRIEINLPNQDEEHNLYEK